jgi:ribonuclease BN (tRNA processing enzyme)
VRVTLHGVRGSTPASGPEFVQIGGRTSCVSVTPAGAAAPSLVLDAGTGLTNLTHALDGTAYRGHVVLTHLHWDHVQGLPFFAAGDRPDAEVVVHLPAQDGADPGVPGSAAALLRRAMSPPHFPIGPEGLVGNWRFDAMEAGWIEIGGARVLVADIPHKGGRTFGIRVEADGASLAYLPDHDPAADPEPGAKLARGVDLLLHDGQFSAAERGVASAYGHATVEDAVDLAAHAGVGRLVLIHHAPGRTDDEVEALVAAAGVGSQVPVLTGREGAVLTI